MLVTIEELTAHSLRLRRELVEICASKGGHLSTSLSCTDILVSLYYSGILKHNPSEPEYPDRDRFILSKGHAETMLYTVLCDRGYFPRSWIDNHYRSGDCRLGGHPDKRIPGVEVSTGSLGHGLGLGAGMMLAAKLDGLDQTCFVLLGDAECTEGSVWETAQFAARHHLSNLIAIVDRNHIGASDKTEHFTGLFDLEAKWKAFQWNTISCNGHDCGQLVAALMQAREKGNCWPTAIIAETTKGKGLSFVENDPMWHVRQLNNPDDIEQARRELQEANHA